MSRKSKQKPVEETPAEPPPEPAPEEVPPVVPEEPPQPEPEPVKAQVEEATALLTRSIDHLREQDDRGLIDYYAADLADAAVGVLTCWLVLQDARSGQRKQELARVFIGEAMPRIHGRVAMLRTSDPVPLRARDFILAESY